MTKILSLNPSLVGEETYKQVITMLRDDDILKLLCQSRKVWVETFALYFFRDDCLLDKNILVRAMV